jgi:uncharacterized Tic20 family protein
MSSSGGTESYATLAVVFIAVGAFIAVVEVSAQAAKTAIITVIAFFVIFTFLSVSFRSLPLLWCVCVCVKSVRGRRPTSKL